MASCGETVGQSVKMDRNMFSNNSEVFRYYCHRNHYQINSLGIFPGKVPVKNTEDIVGEFSSGNSLQDFVHGISVRVSLVGKRQGGFGNGPE